MLTNAYDKAARNAPALDAKETNRTKSFRETQNK